MIVVGYTHELPEELSTTLLEFPHLLAYVGHSDTAYWDLLQACWVSTDPEMVVIEHDIGVKPEAIRDLLNCPQAWCAAMYPFEAGEIFGLGLTKFELAIRQAVPDALEQVALIDQTPIHPPKHFCSMDAWLQGVLDRAGHKPHVHRVPGGVRHHNPRRSHVACR